MKALRSLMASFHVVNLFLHLYGEILSSSTAISNTALILGFHSCSIPITLKRCTLSVATVLALHSLQTEVEITATNPLCACGKIASVIEYWLRFVVSYT